MTRAATCLLLTAAMAMGQTFEAISIKPGAPGFPSYHVDDSTANIGSMSLRGLIQIAYRLPDDQVIQPDWTQDQRFDVHATLPAGAKKEQVPEMLQAMLIERFDLKVHHEQKEMPVYALTVAKDGPKFKESPAEDKTDPGCNGGYRKVCGQVTMESFAILLSRFAKMNAPGAPDKPVIDQTGLTGKYDFVFESGREGGGRSAEPIAGAGIVTYAEALKTLGLKFEPTKHTYDILIVDHVERTPTEN